jgi:hypothetical protein
MSIFFKVFIAAVCISLLYFAFVPEATLMMLLKMLAVGTVASVAVSIVYPEIRGVKDGDTVSVVYGKTISPLLGKAGTAMEEGKKNRQIRVKLNNGSEVVGIVESYIGVITPPRIRVVYEEKLVE